MTPPSWLAHGHLVVPGLVMAVMAVLYLRQFVQPARQLRLTLARALACLQDLPAQDSVAARAAIERDGVMAGSLAPLWTRYARSLQLVEGVPDDAALQAARAHVNRISADFFARVQTATGQARTDLARLERLTQQDAEIAQLWAQYSAALEHLGAQESGGQPVSKAWQATQPAEHFFAEQQAVDAPLRADFFRHVPGILTGAGIIGTFAGLMLGLLRFDVSDPAQVQVQLSLLVQTVGQAFVISALAITLAIVFTWIEKSVLSARYRQVQQLQFLLDALFWPRGGADPLERLTQAAELQAALTLKLLTEWRQQRPHAA
jgi:hypothetical protein